MHDDLIRRAYRVFRPDPREIPPMTLRGGDAMDSYDEPPPYDPDLDEPTDAYLENNFWGLAHLDPVSWRHYLPRLIEHTFRHLDDGGNIVDALFWSLRPPDRDPPRFGALTKEQQTVLIEFLNVMAFEVESIWQDDAVLALEEYWAPGARARH